MKRESVVALLKALGGEVTTEGNSRVTTRCVFAPFRHDGGVDNHPSSGMSVSSGESNYHCFTCHESGSPYAIYKRLKHLYGDKPPSKVNLKMAMKIINDDEWDEDLMFPDYEEEINKTPKALVEFDEARWNKFPKAYTHPYVQVREVPEYLASDIDIRLDFTYSRILFPVRDWDGVLRGIHGRSFLDDTDNRYWAYDQNGIRNSSVWMGEHHVEMDEPIILTEGQFDYAKVLEHYPNVLCGLGTSSSPDKLKRLGGASELITIFDHGVGGDMGRDRIDKFYTSSTITHVLTPEPWGDLGEMPSGEVRELLNLIP